MLRVQVYDAALGRRVYAYGEDRRELRFKTVEEMAERVHPLVGHGRRWPYVYLPEVAPAGAPDLVPPAETKAPRTFRRLGQAQTGRFRRLGGATS